MGNEIDIPELAGELYDMAYKSIKKSQFVWSMLPLHIVSMVDHYNQYGAPLWKVRVLPADGKIEKVETFEEYLFSQPRKGLGLPRSYLWLFQIIDAHNDRREREAALSALRSEIADFDGKVAAERAESRDLQEDVDRLVKTWGADKVRAAIQD